MLGPVNNALEKMDHVFDETIKLFYKVYCLHKNGPSIKTVLKTYKTWKTYSWVKDLHLLNIQSIKEVHKMCIAENFYEKYHVLVNEFKCQFDTLYYCWLFPRNSLLVLFTNGEHHEAIHHTIKGFEVKEGFNKKINKKNAFH